MTVKVGLHIGLPKTGTTSLQELYFERHPGLCYLGQTNLWIVPEAKSMLMGLSVGESSGVTKKAISEIVNKALAENTALVISDEALTLGEYMLRGKRWPIKSDHVTMAERVRNLLGADIHILVVLRNQSDWLESWQRQGLKTAKYTETDFDRWLELDIGSTSEHLFKLLRYDELYDAYANVFGEARVHVRLYEQYRDHLEDLAIEFTSLLGLDPAVMKSMISSERKNVSGKYFLGLPAILQKLVRLKMVSRLIGYIPDDLRATLRNMLTIRRAYSKLDKTRRQQIKDRFADGNLALFRKLGITENNLGYY